MLQEKFMVPPRGGIGTRGPVTRGAVRYRDLSMGTARSCIWLGSPETVWASCMVDTGREVSQPVSPMANITAKPKIVECEHLIVASMNSCNVHRSPSFTAVCYLVCGGAVPPGGATPGLPPCGPGTCCSVP